MKSLVVFAACLAVLLFSGCFFESYRPVGEFDLTLEKAEKTGRALRMLEFRNDSTAGSRMQSRDASGRVIRDPYNRWALPPEQLVARALNLALRPDSESAVPVPVAGTLEVFEVDSARKEFRLAGSWSRPADRRELRVVFFCWGGGGVGVRGGGLGGAAARPEGVPLRFLGSGRGRFRRSRGPGRRRGGRPTG